MFFNDPSLWFLLLTNLTTVLFAITQNWSLSTIMWIYWSQSITIGIFNFIRILNLKEFSTTGFKINNQSVAPTQNTKIQTAFFFLIHFGFFHLVYLMFLLADYPSKLEYIFLPALLFFVNHLFSFQYNHPKDTKKQNIGVLMFFPYIRIIPMHLTIILGSQYKNVLPLFLILKTFADAIMHIVEHASIRRNG